jgi:hypothetical protein
MPRLDFGLISRLQAIIHGLLRSYQERAKVAPAPQSQGNQVPRSLGARCAMEFLHLSGPKRRVDPTLDGAP